MVSTPLTADYAHNASTPPTAPRATAATTGSNGLRPTGVAEAAFEVGEGAEVATLSLFVTETLPRRARCVGRRVTLWSWGVKREFYEGV